ncbi:FxSxx-COOH cyclophane-containing RiPP peptide [Actinocrinis puniceicyclus]|nr:FxSxx-COOH cyclophane-containing RiPP peptide [Actinocrinis puniceicyclus]
MEVGGECCPSVEIPSDIVDLGEVDLAALALVPGSVLERSLRRIHRELTSDELVTAGFASSIAAGTSGGYEESGRRGRPRPAS